MEFRTFGRTGLRLSILGFGCGAVGGLMVRGDAADQERTVARAIAAGVNYFDTAVLYGDGESEKNLGRILQKLKPADVVVGTKVRLQPGDLGRIGEAITASLENSLSRLRLDRVDIFHLHNPITVEGGGSALSVQQVLGEVVPAFERLRQQGKIRFPGLTALGGTAALHEVISAGAFGSAQVVYNMLNPPRPTRCRKTIRRRIMRGCSMRPRRPASASSASACWPAARCRARPSVIRLRDLRRSRSARR